MTAQLAPLVHASAGVAGTRARNEKVRLLAEALTAARDDIGLAATYLSGTVRQDRLDVGWATVRGLDVPPADHPSLTLGEVDAALQQLADAGGPGSRTGRIAVLTDLWRRGTADEQRFLWGLVLGELRQGALEGLVVKGIAKAAGVPEMVVRRALMLSADLGLVAELAMHGGRAALDGVGLEVGRGIQPMLAATAPSAGEAVQAMDRALVEHKLDGARIQVHKDGDVVRVLTRNLNEVTARSSAVIEVVAQLRADRLILDGEVLAVDADGRPRAFQDTMSAFSNEGADTAVAVPMRPFFFDVLHRDGMDLIDQPLSVRRDHLVALVPESARIPGRIVDSPQDAEAVFEQALAAGQEGVVVKALDAPYAAGRRGRAWCKVKPVRTLDLVVLAVEWGSGRRRGLLSNIHMGARDDRPGHDGFVMLGKTFKGMTDEVLTWQTRRFLELESHREGHVVHVRPEQVVEVAIDGIQASTRYPGGIALRFARLVRYRDDLGADDIDTLTAVRDLRN